MRAIWTGAISFGLVNIPVKLYSATGSMGLDLDMLCEKDKSPIRYARICKSDGHEVPYNQIVKGYEYEKGHYVVLTPEDFKKADARKTSTIDIMEFTEASEIDSILYEKPYFLGPQEKAEKPYQLLLESLKETKKVAVAKFVLRNKEHLAVVQALDGILILYQLRFAEEVRSPKEVEVPKTETSPEEVKMAVTLINQLSGDFNPEKYKDTYLNQLKEIIAQKAKGEVPKTVGEVPQPTGAGDLLAALKESLAREKAGKT